MPVGKSIARKDARNALRCAIWQRNGRSINGSQWTTVTPTGNWPEGLGVTSKQAWTQTLRDAATQLRDWQYELPTPTLSDGGDTLEERLTASVLLLFNSMQRYRPEGVATACAGGAP